jgi:hypothetical protein
MKYEIITGGNEVQLVKEVNARIAQEQTVKILDGPFVADAVWCQAILIGEANNRRSNNEIPQRRSGRQDR